MSKEKGSDVRKLIVFNDGKKSESFEKKQEIVVNIAIKPVVTERVAEILDPENIVDYTSSEIQKELVLRKKLMEWEEEVLFEFSRELTIFLEEGDEYMKKEALSNVIERQGEIKEILLEVSGDPIYRSLVEKFQFLSDATFTKKTYDRLKETMISAAIIFGVDDNTTNATVEFNRKKIPFKETIYWSAGGKRSYRFIEN